MNFTQQPNNLRNRWRRYRASRIGYGFTYLPFRRWVVLWGKTTSEYMVRSGPEAQNWSGR